MYALVKHGTVHGFADIDAASAQHINDDGEYLAVHCTESPANGSTYDPATGVFTPPAPPVTPATRRLTKLEYMNRFTDAELAGIYGAAKVSPAVEVWLKKFEMATPDNDGKAIDLDDPRTVGGLQALETATLLAAGRAAEILA